MRARRFIDSPPRHRRRVAVALTAAALVLLSANCGDDDDAGSNDSGHEQSGGRAMELPEPSRDASLGTVSLHLVDQSRNDPFAPSPQPRAVIVNLWYPAESDGDEPLAAYMEPKAAADWEENYELPAGVLKELKTHARDAAPVATNGSGTYPVVVYSPGSTSARAFGTALVEDLASRGYIVATIDHPYDAGVVELPDGTLIPAKEQQAPQGPLDLATLDTLAEPQRAARVGDVRFVIDTLQGLQEGTSPDAEGKPLPANLVGALDLSRIGMLGHSLGGSTAAQALLEDPRILASFALDSAMPPPVRAAGLDKPIMLMRSDQPELAPITDTAWKELQTRGWHKNLHLVDAGHNSFTDLSVFCAQLAGKCPDSIKAMVGKVDGTKAVETQCLYTAAFFDHHLKNESQSLLEEPSSDHPEVEFLP